MKTDYRRLIQLEARVDQSLHNGPMHKRISATHGDPLAFRMLTLYTNGRETLINVIFGDHGLPNRY